MLDFPDNKGEPLPLLYRKALDYIERHAERKGVIKNGIIPFPSVHLTLSSLFHLQKDEAIVVFDELRGAGLLEIVPYRGVRLIKTPEGQ